MRWKSCRSRNSTSRCQASIRQADHLVIIHPLWLGSVPALLKGFLEQVFHPGFAFGKPEQPDRGARQTSAGFSSTGNFPDNASNTMTRS